MKQYNIIYNNEVFPASEYQNLIFDNVEHGANNLIINAVAGASKTTTIVNCINVISDKLRILFIAFNKEIVNEIKNKTQKANNVNVVTFHSLGYSFLRNNNIISNDNVINEFKYKNYIRNNIDNITKYSETKSLKKNRTQYIKNIISLIEYSRYYLCFREKDIKRISDIYGITIIRDEAEVVINALKWGKNNLSEIDYTDMIWLPNVLNVEDKSNQYDWIFIDECQDTSIAEQKLVEKCFRRGTRFIAVGDDAQQINVWAGASKEAIDNFRKHKNVNEYRLPISYRCSKKVIEEANKYTDEKVLPKDNAEEGQVNIDVSEYAPKSGDMVLCRNTAPLIELHLKYNKVNKKSYIRGFENIKEEYLSLINLTKSNMIDKNLITKDGLFPCIYEMLFETIKKVQENNNIDYDDALVYPAVYSIYDYILGLKSIAEGLSTVEQLKDKINIVFEGDNDNAIQLSTVHKAKGLEADNVYILNPSLMPSKIAKKEWEIKTEKNLIYVAITRAKKTLNYIREPEKYRLYNRFGILKMKSDLEDAKRKLETAIGFNIPQPKNENKKKPKINIVIDKNNDKKQPKNEIKNDGKLLIL